MNATLECVQARMKRETKDRNWRKLSSFFFWQSGREKWGGVIARREGIKIGALFCFVLFKMEDTIALY